MNKRTEKLKVENIEGDEYTLISTRIKHLAENFEYEIDSNGEYIEALNAWKVKAVLTIEENGVKRIYSGNACEVIGSNTINMTSALENAETSAIGRACAAAGIGVTEKIASADEFTGAKEKTKVVNVNRRTAAGKSAEEKALEKLKGK